MPDAAPPPTRKKESWLGVVFTALLCAIFLWWWFQPAPITAETERSPLYWAGLARKDLGRAEPTLPMRFEIIMIAEAFRERGEQDAAGKLEADWLPPSWITAGLDGAGGRPADEAAPDPPAAPPPELAPLIARFDEARAALDSLDVERGQDIFRQAADTAGKLPEPLRTQALWLVTARQARNSLTAEASTTRQPLAPATAPDDFPDWLADELLEAEIIVPLLASLQGQPPDAPPVLRLSSQWRSRVRRQAALREPCLISRDGPAADASRPPAPDVQALRQAVEANQLGEAARLAKENPGTQLAVARLLIWLAAPTPAAAASS